MTDRTIENGASRSAVTAAEPFLQAILRTIRDGFWVTDGDLRIVDVNEAYCRMSGYSREELLRLGIGDIDLGTPAQVLGRRAQIARDGWSLFEAVHRRKDGSAFDVEVSVSRMQVQGGRFVSLFRDISDRKRAERELRESRERLAQFMDSASDGFYLLDAGLTFVEVNRRGLEILGKRREDMVGHHVTEVVPDVKTTGRYEKYLEVLRTGEPYVVDEVVPHAVFGDIRVCLKSFRVGDGLGIVIIDLSVVRKAEKELRDGRETLNNVLNTIPQSVFWKDSQLRYLGCNRVFAAAVGLKAPEEVVGLTDFDLPWPRHETETYRRDDHEVIACNCPKLHIIEPLQQADGTRLWIDTSKVPLRDSNGEPFGVLGVYEDVTERRRAEEALRESETSLRTLSDNIPDGFVYQIDSGLDGLVRRFTYVSAGVERIFGAPVQAIMADAGALYEVIAEEDRPRLLAAEAEAVAAMTTFRTEARMRSVSGEPLWYLISSTPRRAGNGHLVWDGVGVDITERKRAEEERLRLETHLSQVQKLDALGLLAAGIAHDFNNLLSGIFGCIDLALEETRGLAAGHHLSRAMESMDRARALTQQLLTFAKGGEPMRRSGSLVRLVEETTRFALSGSNVTARFDQPTNAWLCDFDHSQVAQAIENIVINAQQAMPSGGTIEVDCANVTLHAGDHASLPPGSYSRVSIRDHGIGMPHDILPRIFDPFFTTKQKGHGLGLATSYSIVSRHGGAIDVDSEPGHGSVFSVYLPASPGAAAPLPEAASAEHRGAGTILVMDDEEVVRIVTSEMLLTLGYAVLPARDGREALEVLAAERAAGRGFAGMIFDLTVPGGMGGREALAEIRKLDPDVPVIVSSGYADDPVMADPQEFGFAASIAKPFRRSELAEALRRHLPDTPP